MKSVAIDFGFFIQPQNLKPLHKTSTPKQQNPPSVQQSVPNKKNKKKVAKISSGLSKKQVQALRVF
jgi:hypothetical protein